MTLLRYLLAVLLWLVILALLAIAIVPSFLDRRYYDGRESGHYDGERFFNPDGEDTASTPTRRSRGAFLFAQATGNDGRPPWPARVAVTPAKPPRRVAGDRMLVTWVGHATVLVQTAGLNILTDPIWSDTAGPFGFGPSRVAEPGIRFDDLPPIDLVVVSHNHYDHMDLATLKRLWDRDRPQIVTSLGNDSVIRQAGVPAAALDWGGRTEIVPRCDDSDACARDPRISAPEVIVTRNHHWSSRWFTDRNRALWSSFVVKLPSGGNLFFAGDTGAGDYAWADEARGYGPIRLALLPIGAFRFQPGQMSTGSHVGPVEAVELFRRLGATRAIAIHWGTFRLSYEARDTPPRLLKAAMACARVPGRFDAIAIGRTVEVPVATDATLPPPRPRGEIDRCLDTPAVRALK
ncbi:MULTISPECIES: MBL fold metallo-hydrolase [unclassified Sphingomonas]|uniref:MBL fold metallo-hydrolase n=1 Tax=unclassified Sphingomonas TaxID=196159 RepID=UPI00082BA224|nr:MULTISPECIES: MBL fold metallo-hydrolase [unclassified Sphingomonas]